MKGAHRRRRSHRTRSGRRGIWQSYLPSRRPPSLREHHRRHTYQRGAQVRARMNWRRTVVVAEAADLVAAGAGAEVAVVHVHFIAAQRARGLFAIAIAVIARRCLHLFARHHHRHAPPLSPPPALGYPMPLSLDFSLMILFIALLPSLPLSAPQPISTSLPVS